MIMLRLLVACLYKPDRADLQILPEWPEWLSFGLVPLLAFAISIVKAEAHSFSSMFKEIFSPL